MAKKESESHKRYMERYNRRTHRERVESGGLLASPAGTKCPDWPKFYCELYSRLDLEDYLPQVLSELSKRC
jgi:hypothetical protein